MLRRHISLYLYSQSYPTPGSKDFFFLSFFFWPVAIEVMDSKREVKKIHIRKTLEEIHGPKRAGEKF